MQTYGIHFLMGMSHDGRGADGKGYIRRAVHHNKVCYVVNQWLAPSYLLEYFNGLFLRIHFQSFYSHP